ncbi:DUF4430 domain-containing protein [Candidatus Xianfuyuplasma coldseepsis]|uniref:DUF4430 domain-containing protein n=1 Tax=Candidatus Xianfuyuplasma coldseepsis TaxID=2782163 RepID=A0A7L7KRT8_9MOLU|nr:DUF4430 domain-containing protein [Xianfuyuplasma coldseepsis]QMS85443.1 DUF4430 domain-containing protein [Xianfuyuplasma coldseepsis]
MKKLFSMITVFLLAITMVACSDETDETINDLEAQISELQATNQALETQNSDLESAIQLYEDAEMDVIFTTKTIDLEGHETAIVLAFNDDQDITLKAVAKGFFNADITESEYGAFVNTMNDMNLPYGSYIAIYENDEPSSVGIDDLVIDDGDVFEFRVVWWDVIQYEVYETLHLFIDNHLDDYISTSYIDYNVFLGCQGLCDDVLTDEEIELYLNGLTLSTTQDYFKAMMIANHLENDSLLQTYQTALYSNASTGPYGQTAMTMIALDHTNPDFDYSTFIDDAMVYFASTTPYDEGLDTGGLDLVALSPYLDSQATQDLVDAYVTWIQSEQLPSGGIKTRDVMWNDTTYPGTENAASISQVIIGLIAVGVDPTGDELTVGFNNLITRLLEFHLDDGSFDWDLTDEIENDLLFSTPQAFLALSTYYHYVNSYGEITHLYN